MQEHRIIIEFRLTRRKVLALLAAFFLCWHPAMLGSETLTLTTYYPAPYGGYARLLTTDETLLARDGGAVGIGTGATPLVAGNKLTVTGGAIGGNFALRPAYAKWNAYGVGDGGAAIYSDNDSYKTLMIVGNNSGGGGRRRVGIWDDMAVNGNLTVNGNATMVSGGDPDKGILYGLCRRVNYSTAGGSCDKHERVVGYYPNPAGAAAIYGIFVDESGAPKGRMRLNTDWQGQMICCKIAN